MSQVTLARRTLGSGSLWVFAVGASSPLTVLVGGIVSTYALTGVPGTPLAFAVIMVVLALLAVGYVAMARHVVHSAPFYAQLAQAVGPSAGLAGAAVALLGYNAIQISLYGLIGVTLGGMFGGAWFVWAAVVWAVVAVLGRLRGVSNAKILGALLAVELGVIVLFDLAGFANPADGAVSLVSLQPSSLVVAGLSGALAFSMAAFVGVETPLAFGEEARTGREVSRATFVGIAFLGLFYLTTAWAYATAVGPGQVAEAARDPQRAPFAVLDTVYGAGISTIATILLVTSVVAAMLAFHSAVARYAFALAREGVLPAGMAKVSDGATGGAPLGGSLLQTVVAAVVVGVFVVLGADPMTVMFTWLSTIGAVCVLVLLVGSSLAALAFFAAGRGAGESALVRRVFPTLGGVSGALTVVFMISNLGSLLGTPPGSVLPWLVPALVVGAAMAGLGWGAHLRRTRPEVYAQVGRGTPNALTVQDQRLATLEV
ncbi:MAG: APC family permease [Hamadaea sp.]|nr:APC family permease [Hamadaea sp.]